MVATEPSSVFLAARQQQTTLVFLIANAVLEIPQDSCGSSDRPQLQTNMPKLVN